MPPLRRLTYNQTLGVLAGFEAKMRNEGYESRIAVVQMTNSEQVVGDALLYRLYPLVEESALNRTSNLTPFPNPYPLPAGVSVSFDNDNSNGSPLSPTDTKQCISHTSKQLIQHLNEHGDGSLQPTHWLFRWKSVQFSIRPKPNRRRITYKDALNILSAYSLKLGREGYHPLGSEIIVTQTKQVIGSVVMGPAPNGEIADH
ncbi:MAG: hypothetical protein Q9213_004708 [Squamulea squamosa]